MCIFALAPAAVAALSAETMTATFLSGMGTVFMESPAAAAITNAAMGAANGAMFSAANIAANVGMFGSVLGTGMSAFGQAQQQKAANKQAEYKAQVAENNARTQQQLAGYALKKGRLDERKQRLQNARAMGSQRLGFAAAGVDMAGGSPLDVLEDAAGMGEQGALDIRHRAAIESWRHEAGASDAFAQAGATRASTANPLTKALPTLVSGANSLADRWYGSRKSALAT